MPSYEPPKKNTAYVFYPSLVSQSNTKTMQASPTLAAGDVKVATDDGAPANIGTLPVVDADFTKRIKVSLSQSEMNGDRVTVIFSDASGAEWCDLTVDIATVSTQFDDIPTAAAIATAVWASGTRTLTSFGTLIADIWAYVTRTLTQTAAQVADAVSGSNLTIVRAVTFEATLTGLTIPATWSKVYFTFKQYKGEADSQAIVQIVETNGGDAGDGLLYLNRATGTAAQASLTVNQGAGTVAIAIADNATVLLPAISGPYDLKVLLSDGSSVLLTEAVAGVALVATETV